MGHYQLKLNSKRWLDEKNELDLGLINLIRSMFCASLIDGLHWPKKGLKEWSTKFFLSHIAFFFFFFWVKHTHTHTSRGEGREGSLRLQGRTYDSWLPWCTSCRGMVRDHLCWPRSAISHIAWKHAWLSMSLSMINFCFNTR